MENEEKISKAELYELIAQNTDKLIKLNSLRDVMADKAVTNSLEMDLRAAGFDDIANGVIENNKRMVPDFDNKIMELEQQLKNLCGQL